MRSILSTGVPIAIALAVGALSYAPARAQPAAAAAPTSATTTIPTDPANPADAKPRTRASAVPAGTGVHVYLTCEGSPAACVTPAAGEPAASAAAPRDTAGETPKQAASGVAAAPTEAASSYRLWAVAAASLAGLALVLVGAAAVREALVDASSASASVDASSDAPARSREAFGFRRHWGSFGGESTGWNLSPRLARLLAGGVLVVLGVWMLLRVLAATDPPAAGTAATVAVSVEAKPAPKAAGADAK